MAREAVRIDITTKPELVRLVEEVAQSGRPHLLLRGGTVVAELRPPRSRRRPRKPLTPAQREAFLSSAGGWKGLVDVEQFKRDIRSARSDHRPPVNL